MKQNTEYPIVFINGRAFVKDENGYTPVALGGGGGGTRKTTINNNIVSEEWLLAGTFTFSDFKAGTLTPDGYGSYLPIGNVTANEFVSDLIITQNTAFAPNTAWIVGLGNGAFANPLVPVTYLFSGIGVSSNTLNGKTGQVSSLPNQRYPLAVQPVTILLYDSDNGRQVSELTAGSIKVWYKKELLP